MVYCHEEKLNNTKQIHSCMHTKAAKKAKKQKSKKAKKQKSKKAKKQKRQLHTFVFKKERITRQSFFNQIKKTAGIRERSDLLRPGS